VAVSQSPVTTSVEAEGVGVCVWTMDVGCWEDIEGKHGVDAVVGVGAFVDGSGGGGCMQIW
jgi:hypothetical protein